MTRDQVISTSAVVMRVRIGAFVDLIRSVILRIFLVALLMCIGGANLEHYIGPQFDDPRCNLHVFAQLGVSVI